MKDETGHVYGRLTVLSYAGTERYGRPAWLCRCECGTLVTIRAANLRSGGTRSCGCLVVEHARAQGKKNRRHGHATSGGASRTYRVWQNMKGRGGREIPASVCDRWTSSFESFLADMGEVPPGMSIDRIDSHGSYEPGNCRWAVLHGRASNRSSRIAAVLGNCWG